MLAGVAPLMQLDPENTPRVLPASFPFERVLDGPCRDPRRARELRRERGRGRAVEGRRVGAAEQGEALEVGTQASEIAKNLGSAAPPPQPAGGASA
jgi:hypothetical protein